MDLINFEKLVKDYLNSKSEYTFIEILNALKGYIISVAVNTHLKHYEYEDIVQELEFTVFKALDKYKIETHRAWGFLTTCIKNKMYELYSIDTKLTNLENTLINNTDNSFINFNINIIDEYKTNDLTEIEEEILKMYYIDKFSISEISDKIDKSNSFVTKKKRIALNKITGNNF